MQILQYLWSNESTLINAFQSGPSKAEKLLPEGPIVICVSHVVLEGGPSRFLVAQIESNFNFLVVVVSLNRSREVR